MPRGGGFISSATLQKGGERPATLATSLRSQSRSLWVTMSDADEKLKRLYRLVEDGMTDLDEVLKDRLNTLKSERDRASAALDRARPNTGSPIQIDPALIEHFGRTMRENFTTGSVPFRKAYLQSLIDVIEVDDAQIRIKGSKDVLEQPVLAGGTGSVEGSQMSTKWRARRDSNS
jgi:site-specific DNA recombinase